MSLLDALPDRCTIFVRTRVAGTMGGGKDLDVEQETSVECFAQPAGQAEVLDYDKRGMSITDKVYFVLDPGLNERNRILITRRNGSEVDEESMDVVTVYDSSVGRRKLWKAMCNRITSRED